MPKRVVAVIDDDPSIRTSLGRHLRAHGYACETCASAEEFLNGIATSNANCLLIDIDLGRAALLGLSATTINHILRAPQPPPIVRAPARGDWPGP
jgi:FixJ family two-component response regulator